MTKYAALILPSANRIYADSSVRLMCGEIRVLNEAVLGNKISEVRETTLGGIPYLLLESAVFTELDIAFLSNLSSLYALFEVRGDTLLPITISPLDKFSSDLLTIQKYQGKTNEQFTKLLLNVTAFSIDNPESLLTGKLRIMDPVCGRGTTLNQAVMYGCAAAGIDIDAKDFDAYALFFRTWLKNNRIKHQAEVTPIRRDKTQLGRKFEVALAATKEQYKANEVITVKVINADTRRSGEFFRPKSFDILVADLPYGVQHGSRGMSGELSRSPARLVEEALPGWSTLLRPGGACGLAWNTYSMSREQLADLLIANGFQVFESNGYLEFAHRVDQAINRDLIVARKR